MRSTCLVLLCVLMSITLFSACAVNQGTASDVTPSFSADENHMIRSVVDDLLFENFPVIGIGTIADDRISIDVNRSDEEMGDIKEEILSFLSDTIAMHPDLSGMGIDMRIFQINGTGPAVRIPITDDERGSVFPLHYLKQSRSRWNMRLKLLMPGGVTGDLCNM